MKIPTNIAAVISGMPGEEFILPGLNDLAAGKNTSWEASLILIARTRLTQAGFTFLKTLAIPHPDAERQLYSALQQRNPESAFSQYVSLKKRLNSFIRCLESRDRLRD